MQTEETGVFDEFLDDTQISWGFPPRLFYKPLTRGRWQHFATYLDPYDGVLEFTVLAQHSAMYVMEGRMTPIHKETEEPTDEPRRVRVLLSGSLAGGKCVATQTEDGEIMFVTDDAGEGLMGDALAAAELVLKQFPDMCRSGRFVIDSEDDEMED